ncbi:type IV secretory system conjugative DNA transfer family protein [Kibdelosporangium philippinense]|uniref:Type IV secretory system conjugative DNA transfer family protein n=1 Tax=Kibdelosporangium philippinense TaxID=211113 RepID=A0ABS8ZPS2_9PSEU|nr:type IV secretory system conjugative DNA transfer family protein [Kibdelosporangium philippinense]MCE7009562.1 type IV secretory system conjugative DNA transfer family protein [Kibdelosporangium philippinense]
MPELEWREAFPPDGLSLARLTGMVRVLAGRPQLGVRRHQPVVVFELWISKDTVRWLVGFDEQIARHLPGDLSAQLPGLSLVAVKSSPRQVPVTAREIQPSSPAYPLRLDTAGAVAAGLLGLRRRLGQQEAVVLQWVVGPSFTRTQGPARFAPLEALGMVEPRKPDSSERTAWREKIAEPLFGVRGRVGAVAEDSRRGAQLIGPAVSALSLASGPYAHIEGWWQSSRIASQLWRAQGKRRTWSGSVNAAELAVLLGWPVEGVTVPGRSFVFSPPPRSLLVPADDLKQAEGDRIIGSSVHVQSKDMLVRLPVKSTASHVHVIAPTGAGKSTMLARWILSDIEAGRSLFLLEPKGDLVSDVLARLPREHLPNVRLIEPGTASAVLGFNPLAGPREDAERRADSLLQLFREVFGAALGPRSSDVLLHALIMASRLEDGTLTDVPVILTDSGFRRRVLAKTTDSLTIAPWATWFDSLSEQERSRVVMPILNKLRAFTARDPIRRLLGQPVPSVRLNELYEKPLVVLVNLNAGSLGPETTRLLGSLLLGQLRETVQRQTAVPQAKRRAVSVVVDEWQTFTAGMDFGDMLATARGMATGFTLAHQHLAQLSPSLRAAVLANTRSRVAFRPAKADAKDLAGVLGGQATAETLMTLPAYHAAAQVLVNGATSAPFVVQTPDLPPATENPIAARYEITERYGVDPYELDAQLIKRWQGGGDTPDGAIGMKKRRTS